MPPAPYTMEYLLSTIRRSAVALAAATLLFTLGCSTDKPSLTESTTDQVNALSSRSALDVQIAIAGELRGDGPVVAHVSVTNRTAETVQVPESQLPSEDMEMSQFVITRDGERVRYEGPHIKRGPAAADPIISVAAGATYEYDIELSRAYDLSRDGRYAIAFVSSDMSGRQPALRSAAREVRMYGRGLTTNSIDTRGLASLTSQISYSKCTVTQQTQVLAALNQAATYATESKSYLAGSLGARYTEWFGSTTNSTNTSRVRTNFAAIDDAFANKAVTVDCGCKKTYYAYVYSNQPYKIYVCKAFWSAPVAGTDSRGGTLIHEMSHFTVVAGTNDWAYGQAAARNLALTDEPKAISNADNHEYFAENNPFKN